MKDIETMIAETTTELEAFLEPFLGQEEYGNLRYGTEERHRFGGETREVNWMLAFELSDETSFHVGIHYNRKNDRWTNTYGEVYESREEALRYFKDKVLAIPDLRRDDDPGN